MMIPTTNSSDMFVQLGSFVATVVFVKALYDQYLSYQWREAIHSYFVRYTGRILKFFSPYLQITFEEYNGDCFDRNEIYQRIETYLSEKTSKKARGLKANFVKDGKALVLGLADNEEVIDEFQGVQVWWSSCKSVGRSQTISFYPGTDNERRFYRLTYHGRHWKLITEQYLRHIVEQGKAIAIKKRQRKLFTNIDETGSYRSRRSWSHVDFYHPATFNTLAMVDTKKQAIVNDLLRFSKSKDYYTKIGKPWKRGFLLYGPPGTGKSTMIVAMANFLEYDIYDLELTTVKDNTHLRRLLIETSSKSIIVIEDIDCSLDLTGQRSEKKKDDSESTKEDEKDDVKKKLKEEGEKKKSEVTLSGLLNFIDGIWSACGEEGVIIFTTNHIEKLDHALIRRGRMDMHIELSYCCYEAFKVLAKNYLDVESHSLFPTIKTLLEETNMTPADVGENLMPKSLDLDVEECLQNLVSALEKAKVDDALKKAEEAAKVKEEEAAKVKAEEAAAKIKEEEAAKVKAEEAVKLKTEEGVPKKE